MSQRASLISEGPTKGSFTEIKEIPIYQPSDDQILIKTEAFAINPTDIKHIVNKSSKPGDIAGSDASGIVVKVGSNVKGFKKGDKVSSFLHGNYFKERGAFAEYIIGDPSTTLKYENEFKDEKFPEGSIPSGKIDTFEGAASTTLSLSTAVYSLVANLRIDEEGSGYFLVWGGATIAGIFVIQLIHLYFKNYKVIVAASSKNAEYLKSLGADHVVDYHDSDAVTQIKNISKGQIKYGLDAVGSPSTFQLLYDSTFDSKLVKLDVLIPGSEKNIKKDSRSGSVDIVRPTLVYAANGEFLTLYGLNYRADEATLDLYNDFWFNKVPLLLPKLVHPKLIILKPGLESTNEALGLIQDGKVSGEKIVFRLH